MTARRIMWSFSRVHGGRSRLLFKFNSPFLKISPNFILSTCRSSSFSSFPWSNRRSCPTVWFRSQLSYSTLESLATFSGYHDGPRDDEMNEFLSRFVWIMRRKLVEFYKDLDKQTMNSMLLLIVKKVVSEMDKGGGAEEAENTSDFSEDLWKTVKEVSSMVLEDMQKVERKEKMKIFLHCDEVKVMHKFAWDSGVRGDLLRELRFKWAREKLEKHEAYLRFEKMKQEEEEESNKCEVEEDAIVMEESSGVCFPLRKGELRYKIYGLDLSDRTWEDVADRIHVASDTIWPPEAKEITGKCKLATEKVISMNGDDDDGEEILAEWASLVQPKRVDWMCLLDRVKERNIDLYFKIKERMGSLMGGWDSPVGNPSTVKYERNRSLTKGEIEAFWESKKRIEEDHMKSFSNSQERAEKKKILEESDEEVKEKRSWWVKSNSAILNEPPVVGFDNKTFYSQFHLFKNSSPSASP